MKLLRGQAEAVESDTIKMSVGVVSMSMQAKIMDLSVDTTIEGNLKLVAYCLRNCVESIEIDGADYDPKALADGADISDNDTLKAMMEVGQLCVESIFVSGKDEKKS